ncbi:MAG: oligosaccharide flippase family protein [Gemmatimonadaceae bacterium]
MLRGAGATFLIRVIASGLAYVSLIALVRWMGASEYGAFTYALSWASLLALPAALGLPVASVRFLPEYSAAGEWSRVRGLIGRSITLIVLTSVAIAVIAIMIVMLAGDRIPAAYRQPLLIAFAGLPVITLIALGAQIGRAFGWVVAAYSPVQIWYPLALLAIAGSLVLGGATVTAHSLMIVSVGVMATCVVAQAILYAKRLRSRLRNVPPHHEQRAWLRVATPLLFIDGFNALISYSDILMVGIFLGPSSVAYYFAATRIAALVTFFSASISSLSGPKVAELYSQGRQSEVEELFRGIAPWNALPATAIAVILIAGGPMILPLFGEGFEVGWPALILLAAANLLLSLNGPAAVLLNMTGHQDITAKVYSVAAVANIALNALLIPRFGLTGAALATAISTGAMSSMLVLFSHRTLGIHTAYYFNWRRSS